MRTQTIKLTEQQLNELALLQHSKDCTNAELKRVLAILLVDCASKPELIKKITGYNQKYAFDLRLKYLKRGIAALQDKKKAPKALLTRGQRDEILKIITTSNPTIFGYDTTYWTTAILVRLIKEQYGVQYKSKTSLYIIFKEAKFTYHKPDKKYHKRQQDLVDEWVKKQTPVIVQALNDPKTVVLVEDEMFLSTQTTTQKIWLPQGQFPKIDVSSTRQVRCVYGFLNINSGKEHAFKTMRANSETSCKILNEIGNLYRGYKIVIVWDNAPWHKSAMIRDFLDKTTHQFHLIQFPPYAPDINPQEHVWKTGRSNVTHNRFIEDIDKATDEFIDFLETQIFDYKFF